MSFLMPHRNDALVVRSAPAGDVGAIARVHVELARDLSRPHPAKPISTS